MNTIIPRSSSWYEWEIEIFSDVLYATETTVSREFGVFVAKASQVISPSRHPEDPEVSGCGRPKHPRERVSPCSGRENHQGVEPARRAGGIHHYGVAEGTCWRYCRH